MSFDIKKMSDFADSAASGSKPKTISKYKSLAKIYPKIEEALAGGYTHKEYVDGLNSAGMKISLNTFRSCLYRLREKHEYHSAVIDRIEKGTAKENLENAPVTGLQDTALNDAETLVGWRIPESIRSWVKVKDGKIITNLPKGLVLNHDIRDALKKLKPYE